MVLPCPEVEEESSPFAAELVGGSNPSSDLGTGAREVGRLGARGALARAALILASILCIIGSREDAIAACTELETNAWRVGWLPELWA